MKGFSRVGFAYPSDSEEEGQKRVVKAHKDRKFEELKDLIKQAKNSRNIKDMSKLLSSNGYFNFFFHLMLEETYVYTYSILSRGRIMEGF